MTDAVEVVYKATTETSEQSELLKPNIHHGRKNSFLYIATITANLLAFCCGAFFSWSSPAYPKLNGQIEPHMNPLTIPLTQFQEYWIGGVALVGAAFGCVVSGIISEKMGRKKALIVSAIPALIASFMLAFAQHVSSFYMGRFLSGITAGFAFAIVPIYVGEIAESNNRGILGCFFSLFISAGLVYSYFVGPFLSVKLFTLTLVVPLIIFMIIFTLFIPESPLHFISLGETENALHALKKFRIKPENEIKIELAEMIETFERNKIKTGGLREIFKSKGLTKALAMMVTLIALQQACGAGIVLSFLESIFASTGINMPAKYAAMIVGTIQFITNLGTSSVAERFRRRILLLVSSAGTAFSIFFLGLYFHLQTKNFDIGFLYWLPVTSLVFYIIFLNLGVGPLPWAIIGEIFPANVRSIASTMTSLTCFIIGILLMVVAPYMNHYLGTAWIFWTFALSGVTSFLFVFFYLIETKGKSLDQIQRCLNGEIADGITKHADVPASVL